MSSLAELVSSIIKNREETAITQNGTTDDQLFRETIKQLKRDVVQGRIDPSQVDKVHPEVVESWIRSRKYGLDIYQDVNSPVIEKSALKALGEENSFLIDATISTLQQFEPFLNTNYDVILCDAKGVNLLTIIGLNDTHSVPAFNLVPGTIWNEETIGTSSMSLCLRLKRPIQISGPETYFDAFNSVTGSSAPIFDNNRNLAGVLTIGTYYSFVNSLTLSLAISIAELIENEYQLTLYREMFKAAYEVTEDALINIDNHGIITYINKVAIKMFKYPEQELIGQSIEYLFGNQPEINLTLATKDPLHDAEITINNIGPCLFSIHPVKDTKGDSIGFIIILKKRNPAIKALKSIKNPDTRFTFDSLIGESPQMIKSVNIARKFALLDSNMLLQGESGTGKEVFAQAIHNERHPNGPFIAVNCGAIPKTLIESELFGYEGGAFTGANRNGRQGKIEQANGGTLFLDEIGDMPLELQPVLLRVLEERRVVRVGGSRSYPVDFKLVTATHKDLWELVKTNQFREDLYYRLAAFKIVIPPLRDRGLDIINLIKYFITKTADKQEKPEPTLSNAAKYSLIQYNWPGNVRQLENAINYAVAMSTNGIIKPEDLPDEIQNYVIVSDPDKNHTYPAPPAKSEITEHLPSTNEKEKAAIAQALLQTGYNINDTSRLLGISRSTLYRKIKKYNL